MATPSPSDYATIDRHDVDKAERDFLQTIDNSRIIAHRFFDELDRRLNEYAQKKDNQAKVKIDPKKPTHRQVWIGKRKVADLGNKKPSKDFNKLDAKSSEYLSQALSKEKGYSSPDLDRNVRIKVNGKMMFQVRDGQVITNEFLERDRNLLSIELDDPSAKGADTPNQEQSRKEPSEPNQTKAVIGNEKTPAKPRSGGLQGKTQVRPPTPQQVKPITDDIARMEEQKLREKRTPENLAIQLQSINKELGKGDGSGHRLFVGENIKIQSYGKSELLLTRQSDNSTLFELKDGEITENNLSSRDQAKINSIYDRLQKTKEAGKSTGQSKGMAIKSPEVQSPAKPKENDLGRG